jgi:hypothetical protein
VRALPSSGFRGSVVKLRYRVADNSGSTREIVTVYRGRTARVKRVSTRFGPTGKTYFVRWRSPRGGVGWRFCVQAFDRAGNKSAVSCARIRLKR